MKKFILFTVAVLLMLSGVGCKGGDQIFDKKEYAADAKEVSEININVRDRKINVSPSDDDKIHIAYMESDKKYYNLSLSEGQILSMTSSDSKAPEDYIGVKPEEEMREISLQIPKAVLKKLSLSTTNEDIVLNDTDTEEVQISSNGGDVSFSRLAVDTAAELDVKNGDITGTIIGGYDDFEITAEIKKGECNLPEKKEGGDKTLKISCNNGDTDVDFVK